MRGAIVFEQSAEVATLEVALERSLRATGLLAQRQVASRKFRFFERGGLSL
jgi:hypothetical protein